MHIHKLDVAQFRHLRNVSLGPFSEPSEQSDILVLAGPNGGGKSSILELLGYAISQSYGFSYAARRNIGGSSFEVGIKLSGRDIEDLRNSPIVSQNPQYREAFDYINARRVYYRSFNYPGGEYSKNPSINETIQQICVQVFRHELRRLTGFSLKADRGAITNAFQRDSLFNHYIGQKDYLANFGFTMSEQQTRHILDYLITERFHYARRLGEYHIRLSKGEISSDSLPPEDPMIPYVNLLGRLFPGYTFASNGEDTPTNLFVNLPSGETIPFDDLSSGEREVFLVLSNFIRYAVQNSIILIDEPELHLHPELSRILMRNMRALMPHNQIWAASHNAEVIDEAGRDKTIYISRDKVTKLSVVVNGSDEPEAMKHLRDIFGFSGFIGVAKTMVFLEGLSLRSDRKLFSSLFLDRREAIKFVPANSSEDLPRINSAILSILESNMGEMKFYMIRDRDYLPDEVASALEARGKGKLHVLQKCHIENYILIPQVMAEVQTKVFEKPTTAERVILDLKAIAVAIAGEVLRDMISFRLNLVYRPQDFSLGNYMKGRQAIDADGNWENSFDKDFETKVLGTVASVNESLLNLTKEASIKEIIESCRDIVSSSIKSENNEWLNLFPGKRLLNEYIAKHSLGKDPVFLNLLISKLARDNSHISRELIDLIEKMENSQPI